jgi:hypothetical protein
VFKVTAVTLCLLCCRKCTCKCLDQWFWTSFTYLVNPCSIVLIEKLTGSQLFVKFPVFYGTRKFITAFTSACHLSVFWASSIQSMPPSPTFWRSILILSSHLLLGLPSVLVPSGFPTRTLHTPLFYLIRDICAAHLILEQIFHDAIYMRYMKWNALLLSKTGPKGSKMYWKSLFLYNCSVWNKVWLKVLKYSPIYSARYHVVWQVNYHISPCVKRDFLWEQLQRRVGVALWMGSYVVF